MQMIVCSAAAPFGLPPFYFVASAAQRSAGTAADLWLVIALLLIAIFAGGGILCMLTAGLDRAERRVIAAFEGKTPPTEGPLLPESGPGTHPERKNPLP